MQVAKCKSPVKLFIVCFYILGIFRNFKLSKRAGIKHCSGRLYNRALLFRRRKLHYIAAYIIGGSGIIIKTRSMPPISGSIVLVTKYGFSIDYLSAFAMMAWRLKSKVFFHFLLPGMPGNAGI